MKDDLIKGYKIHRAKQSASIEKLKGEMTELKEGVSHLEKEVAKRDPRIKYLEEEVDLEKRHRLEAQERARSEWLAADHAKLDLKEERVAHEKTQATVQALEAYVTSLDSKTFKAKVIEEYRHSALGKVKVALACKAGFDYLASQLPPGSRPLTDNDYPPRVSVCLNILREIEMAGGGVVLELDEREDDEPRDGPKEAVPAAPPAALLVAPPATPLATPPAAPIIGVSSDLLSPTPWPGPGV